MQCLDCRWNNGKHDPACPQLNPDKRFIWDTGYNDGRAGLEEPPQDDPTYLLGFAEGLMALETAQNRGPDPRFV